MRYQKAVELCEDRRSLLKEARSVQFEAFRDEEEGNRDSTWDCTMIKSAILGGGFRYSIILCYVYCRPLRGDD